MQGIWVERTSFGTPWGTIREVYTPLGSPELYREVTEQLVRCGDGVGVQFPLRTGRLAGAVIEIKLRRDIGLAAFNLRQRERILASSYVVWKHAGLVHAFTSLEDVYLRITDQGAFVEHDAAKITAPSSVPWVGELMTATLGAYRIIFEKTDPDAVHIEDWLGEIMEVLPSVGTAILDSQMGRPAHGPKG